MTVNYTRIYTFQFNIWVFTVELLLWAMVSPKLPFEKNEKATKHQLFITQHIYSNINTTYRIQWPPATHTHTHTHRHTHSYSLSLSLSHSLSFSLPPLSQTHTHAHIHKHIHSLSTFCRRSLIIQYVEPWSGQATAAADTVRAIIIWSLADFVGLPTYKEWNSVYF